MRVYLYIASLMFLLGACTSEKKEPTIASTKVTKADEAKGQERNVAQQLTPGRSIKEAFNITPSGKTISGYEYVFHKQTNNAKPQEGEYAYINYYMRVKDSLFLNSAKNGITKAKISKAKQSFMTECISYMSKGDSLSLYFPIPDQERGTPRYKGAEFMVYDVALLDIKTADEYKAEEEENKKKQEAAVEAIKAREPVVKKEVAKIAKAYKAGKLASKLKTTPSGLQYMVSEKGKGPRAKASDVVEVHYYGILEDGTPFDNSFKKAKAFQFPLGANRVIKGWEEGIAMLHEGDKAYLFIPYVLAYGEGGSPPRIPARADLVFYVEVETVMKRN